MVRDVDNHGHKIWRPFSALDASNNAATTLALDGSTTATDRLMLSNARQIEFVLHKNIVNSVRFLSRLLSLAVGVLNAGFGLNNSFLLLVVFWYFYT